MKLPVLRKRPVANDDVALQKALGAVAAAFLAEEQLRKGFLNGNAAVMPGSSWSNQGTINSRLIGRVTQNLGQSFGRAPEELELALAEQGLSWGPPFPPGRPLDPFWGYRRPPRTWDYAVGENVQLTPRWDRISFPTLKAIINSYYAAQICIRHLINDVRSLDYQFVPPMNVQEDATEDLERCEAFFRYPDRRQPFRAWLAEYLQDVLRFDAGTLYVRRNEAYEPIALEVVSGATIIPLLDFFGRVAMDEDDAGLLVSQLGGEWDGKTVPAYLQIVEGLPWDWLASDDIIYQPWNPLPDSQYGLAPMEAVLMQANTDIRFQWHFLQYFTEGSLPAGFMEAPPDLSDPVQITEWQETWDAFMVGDQSKLRQIRWVPSGSKFTAVKNSDFADAFPLYLMRCTAAAFGVTPNDLGFTENVNRSTGDTQVDVQFRVGTLPLVRHVEDLLNAFIAEHLKLKARLQFDVGREVEDRLATAQAEKIYIDCGVLSPDEPRMRLGKRVSRDRPSPRIFNNTRSGPIPLLAVESLAGKIDPTTFGPAKDQQLIDHPFAAAPGVSPVLESDDYRASRNSTATMQANMLVQNADQRAPKQARRGDGTTQTEPVLEKALEDALSVIDALLALKDGASVDNTGGPGVTRGFSNPTTITGGISVDTDLQGVDLDEDEEDKKALRQWRENALNRVRKGLAPRLFEDVPPSLSERVWPLLQKARNREEVRAAFAELGKAPALSGAEG